MFRNSILRPLHFSVLPFIAMAGLLAPAAQAAAPKAVPKTFKGTYTASGFCSSSTDERSVNRSYQGKVEIDSTGKVSGRISRTQLTYITGGDTKESKSRVTVSGKITKVVADTHAGFKVLVATTRITLSDGGAGTLTLFYPYTVASAGMSGSGPLKNGKMEGSMTFQKQP